MNTREMVRRDLSSRPKPLRIDIASLVDCPRNEYVGKFPLDEDYNQVINSDCDVFVGGKKVISFRKSVFPRLREGSDKDPQTWEFFRMASREVYGTQRGVVAGTELTTRPEARLTRGQFAFFTGAASGLVSTMEEARVALNSSLELTVKTLKIKYIKRDFPTIAEQLKGVESEIRKHKDCETSLEPLREQRRTILWSWFEPWLNDVWQHSQDKVEETRRVLSEYISIQLSFNHCYSNVLGAIDRGARFPYGRLSGTTQRHYDKFSEYQDVYSAACEGFRFTFPETWEKVRSIIARVKDPNYNLFGTAFTSTTINYNFKTAYHVDKNNLKGGLAVLTAMTKGSYEGHYLVFPEVRLAFDLRDGDFIVGDTQTLLHGNSPMTKLSGDAERVSLVFYSRENMTRLDSLECESCRKEFVKHSSQALKEKSKNHKDWRGVWEGMWVSQEWLDFRRQQGLEHCSNSNWQLSSPYRNLQNGNVTLFKDDPGPDWELVQVLNKVR